MRIGRQRSDSNLTREQIMAAYELYCAGMSVPEIAGKIWERFGYASQRACVCSLYYSFSSYKLKMRKPGPARWHKHSCSGCGCPRDEFNRKCRQCQSRHSKRRENARKQEKELLEQRKTLGLCAGCGGEMSEKTIGCAACQSRYTQRKRRKERGDVVRAYEREYSRKRRERKQLEAEAA